MKTMKKLALLVSATAVMFGCKETPEPTDPYTGTAPVSLTVEWDNLQAGDTAPTNYTLLLDGNEYEMNSNTFDSTFYAGQNQEFLIYNNPMGIIVSNEEAKLAEMTRVATDPEQHPENLYYGRATVDLMSNTQNELTIPTKRGTAPLTVKVAYDMSKVGGVKGDIIATLSGVAATRNLHTDALSDAVKFATTVTLDAATSEFVMTFNILGVVGSSQVITFDIEDINGNTTTLYADITDALADFNADMEPLEVDATLSIPNAKWLLSEITSAHYPSGTVWTIEADTETPTLANFESIRHVLTNLITTDGSIDLTLTKATTIPDGSGYSSEDYTGAFINCLSLKSISLPDATTIGINAFSECDSLTDVNAPNVSTIGEYTFLECHRLKNLTLDFENIREIPQGAFQWCEGLTELYFPNAFKIGRGAFSHCFNLISLTLDFENIREIPTIAFNLCTSLTSLSFPEVNFVEQYAFWNCTSLESLTLGKATTIERSVTSGCHDLTTLNIGTELTNVPADADININAGAFSDARSKNISLRVRYGTASGEAGNMSWTPKSGAEPLIGFNKVVAPNTKWLLSEITSTEYPIGPDWHIEADTANPTLADFDSLRHVLSSVITTDGTINLTLTKATTIPDGSGSFYDGTGAFFKCDALKSIAMPQATSLGVNALYNCSELTEVDAPNVTKIGISSFSGCLSLETLELDFGNITEIPNYGFSNCGELTELNFPNVTTIGESAFNFCTSLESITLGKATEIGEDAFNFCSSLESITLDKATKIGNVAFRYCGSLKSITLGKATEIGYWAFFSCDELTTVNIGTELTAAPAEADIIVDSDAFDYAPVENITLTVGYGTASGEAGNMNWTPKSGVDPLTGFNSVVEDTNY